MICRNQSPLYDSLTLCMCTCAGVCGRGWVEAIHLSMLRFPPCPLDLSFHTSQSRNRFDLSHRMCRITSITPHSLCWEILLYLRSQEGQGEVYRGHTWTPVWWGWGIHGHGLGSEHCFSRAFPNHWICSSTFWEAGRSCSRDKMAQCCLREKGGKSPNK